VAGVQLFVYQAPVRAEILSTGGLASHKPDYAAERASFVIFDMSAPVTVRVVPGRPFKTAALRPERAGIATRVEGGAVEFTLDRPRKMTLLLDGDTRSALHLFAGEPEKDIPAADDPNVLYFGPGVHETTGIALKSGQTLYLAGGAVLKAKLKPGDTGTYSEEWKVVFHHGSVLGLNNVKGVRICGRGIIDAGGIPHPGWNMLWLGGARHVQVDGITLRNAANWNFMIGHSEEIEVRDVRIVSGRLNSDGINSVNSRQVRIRDCFVRNHDDSIVVKTTATNAPAEAITVEGCTVWSDWGYALGVTYETRSPVRNILFRGTILKDCWGKDPERGLVRNVVVDGVTLYGKALLPSELNGADVKHDVRGVKFCNIRLAGQPPVSDVTGLALKTNAFVSEVTCSPVPAR